MFLFPALCAALMTTFSCHFLEVEQVGKSDIEGFFSEPNSARAALNGVMHLSYSFVDRYMILYSEIASDEVILSSNQSLWTMYHDFTSTPDDETGAVGQIWKNGYQAINNCNQIIEHVPLLMEQFPTDAPMLEECMAQALFMRAYLHHCLCLCYGQNYSFTPDASHPGVFYASRTQALDDTPARVSVAEVYENIILDLNKSLEAFQRSGSGTNRFLPSPMASRALLARVCLYMGDWANAAGYAGEVIAEKPLVSRDNYFNMFYQNTDVPDDECIFRINGSRQSLGCYNMFWNQEPGARPSERVLSLFEDEDDIRKSLLEDAVYGNLCRKYDCNAVGVSKDDVYKNIPILRVSEMYLIRAEASHFLNDDSRAAADIEALRCRALGKKVSLDEDEKDNMPQTIAEERIRELCFEGHRLWDITRRHENLVRTSDASSTLLQLDYPDYRFVLAIPSVETEANGKMQPNPGYGTDDGGGKEMIDD